LCDTVGPVVGDFEGDVVGLLVGEAVAQVPHVSGHSSLTNLESKVVAQNSDLRVAVLEEF
jgi:hypothetical protein